MAKIHFLLYNSIILLLCSVSCATDSYFSWIPPKQTRTDLVCPECCRQQYVCYTNARDEDDCCLCRAKPYWESYTSEELVIEYFNRRGEAIVMGSKESNTSVLKHANGYLSQLPVNLCDFQNSLKFIDLQQNKILDIGNISCLINLDTLLLKQNKIKLLKSETLKNLNMLRKIDLSKNELIRIEPGIFENIEQGILEADFSENKLQTVDVSNFIIEKPFCKINYETNSITQIVNELDWKIDINKEYGKGGMVLLGDNDFQNAIDFSDLGVADLSLLSKLIYFGFDVRGAKWNCNCKMVPFLQLAEDFIKKIWRSYFDVKCFEPANLKDQSIAQLVRDGHLDQFICDYSNTSVCPMGCFCFEQTRDNRTIVNCTSSNIRVLPETLPNGTNLELYFGHNKIKELGNKEYLQRSSILKFTNNEIKNLNELSVSSVKFMNFSDNQIETIHKSFQRIDLCNIELGHVNLTCVCEDLWIKDWINFRNERSCNKTVNNITCKNLGYISITETTTDMLGCVTLNDTAWIIGAIICVVMSIAFLLASLYHFFYVEIYLLRRNFFNAKEPDDITALKYDAYVSVDEEEYELRVWALNEMTKKLESAGYKIFLPFRDVTLGSCREESINEKISESKNYIVLLSKSTSPWTSLEWKYAWNQYRSDTSRNIIIVNFDHQDTGDIHQREIKAFSRLGWLIDFADVYSKTFLKIRKVLGVPFLRNRGGMNNANVRFRRPKNNYNETEV